MNSNLVALIPQFLDSSGNPLSGGTLNTYVAGTSTTLATYPTNADAIAGTNANPTSISINTNGYPSNSNVIVGVFLKPGKQYKFILKDGAGTTVYTLDNISNLTDAIYDANNNEVLKLVGVSSAINEITITNSITGNNPTISATGDDTNINISIKPKGSGSAQLIDSNGNEVVKTSTTPSAVNEVTVVNAATGNAPSVTASGDDTNINISIKPKGSGSAQLIDGNGNEVVKTGTTASAVNEITITNAITANNPTIAPTGDDTNIGLTLKPKGTGTVQIQDSSGNVLNKAPTIQKITATGAFTYTAPAGLQAAIFELQGAGGGSGGAGGGSSTGAVGAGGGGGGYLKIFVTGSANLAAITGSVGAGGTAGDSGITTDGGAGGNTTLVINSGSTWTASGGSGGGRQGASGSPQTNGGTLGGNTASGTNGTLIYGRNGGDAGIGMINSGAGVTNAFGSSGGEAQLGGRTQDTGLNSSSRAAAGKLYGGGAAGATNGTGGNLAGATGANGIVIVTEFYL